MRKIAFAEPHQTHVGSERTGDDALQSRQPCRTMSDGRQEGYQDYQGRFVQSTGEAKPGFSSHGAHSDSNNMYTSSGKVIPAGSGSVACRRYSQCYGN